MNFWGKSREMVVDVIILALEDDQVLQRLLFKLSLWWWQAYGVGVVQRCGVRHCLVARTSRRLENFQPDRVLDQV